MKIEDEAEYEISLFKAEKRTEEVVPKKKGNFRGKRGPKKQMTVNQDKENCEESTVTKKPVKES